MGLVIELSQEFDISIDVSEIIDDLTIKNISEIISNKLI
jgi:hypothetical protein